MKPTYLYATVTTPDEDHLQYKDKIYKITSRVTSDNSYLLEIDRSSTYINTKWFNAEELTLHT